MIRQATASDWDLLLRTYQLSRTTPLFTAFAEATTFTLPASFAEYRHRRDSSFWILQRGHQLAGFVFLQDIDATNHSANIDIGFFDAPFTAGSQDAAALNDALRQACIRHDLTRLQIAILDGQAAKLALIESLGFQKEGVLREQFYWQGAQRDLVCLARLER